MLTIEIGDWFTFGAVVVALFFGIWAIVQSNLIQKKQQRRTILRELIEWCIKIIEAIKLEEMPIVGNQDLEIACKRVFGNKIFKLLALRGVSEYMQLLAAISPTIQSKVNELHDKLNEIIDLTLLAPSKKEINIESISDKTFRELQKIAEDTISSATLILTKNLF